MLVTAEQLELFPGIEQIQLHHAKTKGYIALLRQFKNGKRKQITLPAAAMAERIYDLCRQEADCWISQNGFYKNGTRRVADIGQLVALYVDLDCHKVGIAADVAEKIVYREFVDGGKIPRPSTIIYSGQGLQLIWRINPETIYALPIWQGVEDWLIDRLKLIGADPQSRDAARVLRVAGTFNLKNNAIVEIKYDSPERLSLTDICKRYILPAMPLETTKKGKPKRRTVKNLFNEHSLFFARMNDIRTLIMLRKKVAADAGKKWGRETLLFLYRYYSCMFSCDPEKALEETLELNNLFREPLPTREVIAATRSAESAYSARNDDAAIERSHKAGYRRPGYNYKTQTLVDMLEITPEEQKQMKNLIAGEEKQSRKRLKRYKEGRSDRRGGQAPCVDRQTYLFECKQENQNKIQKVKELRDSGLSTRKIADVLGISKSAVDRYLKAGASGKREVSHGGVL